VTERVGAALEAARRAQKKVRRIVAEAPAYCGIGITFVGDGYGVKVNFRETPSGIEVPAEIDGVPIVIDVVGRIEPL
jgi:hypothetical protein